MLLDRPQGERQHRQRQLVAPTAARPDRRIQCERQCHEPKRKLYRSRANRTIAGVCCGLADYFGVDRTLIRVIFVVLNVFGGAGIVLYLVLWIIVPNEPEAT